MSECRAHGRGILFVLVPIVVGFVGLLSLPALALVTTLYVDRNSPACSDAGPGSQATPFCTINAGATKAVAGQTVLVASGSYTGTVTVASSGTPSAPIVIQAASGATVNLTSTSYGFVIPSRSWVTIRGFNVSGTTNYGIYVNSSSHVSILDNHVSYSGLPQSGKTKTGINVKGTDSLVSGNTVDHNSDAGITLAAGTTGVTVRGNTAFANARGYTRAAPGIDVRATGNAIVGNVSHDNEDSGIQFYNAGGNLAANNVVYRNGDHGIDDLNSPNQTIVGNSVYLNRTAGINVEGTSPGAMLANNVSVDNAMTNTTGQKGNIRIDQDSVAGTSIDYDLVFLSAPGTMFKWNGAAYSSLAALRAATGQEPHGLETDPKWSAPGSGDFHLSPGSPAIDSANSGASGQQATDIEGNARVDDPGVPNTGAGPRAFDDRGAYESQLTSPPTDNPPSAALIVTPSSGTAPLAVSADASASTDPDPTPIATYRFDFGDGTVVGPQAGATATHTFQNAGTYTVRVTVTDTAGLSTDATKQVTVSAPSQDNPPSAALIVTPSSGTAPLAVSADASASTDPDPTPIATYRFDFGDGTVVGPQAGATATHTFQNAGTYTVRVTVTDTAGLSTDATRQVTVDPSNPNLVGNPGFEMNLSGWNTSGTSGVTLTQVSGGHSGSFAARVSNTGSASVSCTLNDSPNWISATSAGTYTASVWVRSDSPGGTLKLRFREYSGSSLVGTQTGSIGLTTSWNQVTLAYVPAALGSSLDLNAYVSNAAPGVCFYADDVTITHP